MKLSWAVTAPVTSMKRFLSQQGISHRGYSDLKHRGIIWVNGRNVDQTVQLQVGDEVTVILPPEVADPEVAVSTEPLTILFSNRDWVIVDKPAGLNVVPGPANRTDTLVNRLKGVWQAENAENRVPHIVTRLDRFTSGLVWVARHRLANSLASQLQAAHTVEKRYLAIVSGQLTADHDLIDAPLAPDPTGYNQMVSPAGKPAQTEYWVQERFADATLVRVQLHTGRTHQIRAHFASLGHPLVGDELYHGPLLGGMHRQALHAATLDFTDPFTQENRHFNSPVPADWQALVATLRQ
ncbi:pseudouridine synthase [Levilactobacillus zymae]|uniref:Pseudouridine synthase n=1 Tax=Levilactobacillus zymae TaxID=267363 RepID=A0ABQ0WU46_9LACO|nr:RluA family pseudouridine synthase [Levilactobacillus zymae]KRL10530.1 pseudouridylate synthase [Levilactobacillus zymae DSM 19395]QFR60206.1 RluA family pseudouridine synthase [Levilactobacillus zymae]GEO71350.1 pseudouridine synthase [Levilactobacillus zymae]